MAFTKRSPSPVVTRGSSSPSSASAAARTPGRGAGWDGARGGDRVAAAAGVKAAVAGGTFPSPSRATAGAAAGTAPGALSAGAAGGGAAASAGEAAGTGTAVTPGDPSRVPTHHPVPTAIATRSPSAKITGERPRRRAGQVAVGASAGDGGD